MHLNLRKVTFKSPEPPFFRNMLTKACSKGSWGNSGFSKVSWTSGNFKVSLNLWIIYLLLLQVCLNFINHYSYRYRHSIYLDINLFRSIHPAEWYNETNKVCICTDSAGQQWVRPANTYESIMLTNSSFQFQSCKEKMNNLNVERSPRRWDVLC